MIHRRRHRTFSHVLLIFAISFRGGSIHSALVTAFQIPLVANTRSTSDRLHAAEGTTAASSTAAILIRKSLRRNNGIARLSPLYYDNSNDNDHNDNNNNYDDAALADGNNYDDNDNDNDNDDDEEFTRAVESNNLQNIINYLQTPPSPPSTKTRSQSLTTTQLRAIFDAIETATAETDENTVNKRVLQDQTILQASSAVEFRSLDRVRAQMTKLYGILREEGVLTVFGAVARPPPPAAADAATITRSNAERKPFETNNGNAVYDGTAASTTNGASQPPPPPPPIIYPTAGSKLITPTLLEQITDLAMSNLTPRATNSFLYGGIALALAEGLLSLSLHVNFNLLVASTLLLALADQLLVSGAVFETLLRMTLPELKTRITKHEAGHFLMAYLLGCPVEGVVLSTWAAMNDGRFGGRSGIGSAISAGTSYYDLDLSEQIAGKLPLTRESIDRYSVIVMGGIAAEAVEYGEADGGAGDEEALVRFLRSLNPRGGRAVREWSPELIRNQARWGVMQAVLLLREYRVCYEALVDALERGGDLGRCVVAIEEAAEREGLGWLGRSKGVVLEEGEFGRWVEMEEWERERERKMKTTMDMEGPGFDGYYDGGVVGGAVTSNANGGGGTNGVPTYGKDPITSTEEFLQQYREAMEKKLRTIDEELQELDNKNKR
ncbi:hypothetical protein ACHAXS_005180 [Conticribra weissflogii]